MFLARNATGISIGIKRISSLLRSSYVEPRRHPIPATSTVSRLMPTPKTSRRPLVKSNVHESFDPKSETCFEPGDTVELDDGDFFRVLEIIQHGSDLTNIYQSIRGWRFRRTSNILGLPAAPFNEVFWVCHLTKNDGKTPEAQSIQEVDAVGILGKRLLRMVSSVAQARDNAGASNSENSNIGSELFCQWKHVFCSKTEKIQKPSHAFDLAAHEFEHASFERLRPEECDEGSRNCIPDEALRRDWQDPTKIFNSYPGQLQQESNEDNSLRASMEYLSLNSAKDRDDQLISSDELRHNETPRLTFGD
ncbi:hypothetical protein MMC28_010406 [Mycoblastus sanguinarius]|nr:hypothetical protein [Mycoblastus sanguinarius]